MKKGKADRLLKQRERRNAHKARKGRKNRIFSASDLPFLPPFAPSVGETVTIPLIPSEVLGSTRDMLGDLALRQAVAGLSLEEKLIVSEVIRSFRPLVKKAFEGKKGARGKKPQVSSLVQ
jgi:hypothetical protein